MSAPARNSTSWSIATVFSAAMSARSVTSADVIMGSTACDLKQAISNENIYCII